MSNYLNKVKRIYFVGIKGVGMTALACIAQDYGLKVAGSDLGEKFVTDGVLKKRMIVPQIGFDPDLIAKAMPDLVIFGAAHQGEENPLVKKARKLKIKTLTQAELLAEFSNPKFSISVCGVGGKTTTTAILSTILKTAGKHPSYLVGAGGVSSLPFPGKYDKKGNIFVSEADEYACSLKDRRPKFCFLKPRIIILTNLGFDHPDIYKDEKAALDAFAGFINSLSSNDLLIANSDSLLAKRLIRKLRVPILTYGVGQASDWQIADYQIKKSQGIFYLKGPKGEKESYVLNVPGLHNALNAVGAILAAKRLLLKEEVIKEGILKYKGCKRRFEKIAQIDSSFLYDDYAHHPLQIEATLKTAKEWFEGRKIVAIFQPHTYSRTKALLREFGQSFSQADEIIVTDIFASAREKKRQDVSSLDLVRGIKTNGEKAVYCSSLKETLNYLRTKDLDNTVIFTLGAGDIFSFHEGIIKLFKNKVGKITAWKRLKAVLGEKRVKFSHPMASETTIGLGGPARVYYQAKTESELICAVKTARNLNLPYLVLGSGSNIIISDKGIKGLVIKNLTSFFFVEPFKNTFAPAVLKPRLKQLEKKEYLDKGDSEKSFKSQDKCFLVRASSGFKLQLLIERCFDHGLTGLEWFAGIPGSLGGAVYENVHGGDYFFSDFVYKVKVLETSGKIKEIGYKQLEFAYDYSRFQKSKEMILSVELVLFKGDLEKARQIQKKWLEEKLKVQPQRSAGSIWQNLDKKDQQRLHLASDSIGFLIDKKLRLKGRKIGRARICPTHAGFIENLGGAKTSDVLELMGLVERKALKKFGIKLKREVVLKGEF